jgi:hypothetical protein
VAATDGIQAGLAIDEVTEVGELAGPAEDADSPLLAGAMLSGGNLVGVVNMPAVLDALAGPTP